MTQDAPTAMPPRDTFRVIVTGSRNYPDPALVEHHIRCAADYYGTRLVIVHGACETGADAYSANVCARLGIATEPHPADWTGPCRPACEPGHRRNGVCPAAGPFRNQDMVSLGADLTIAFPHGRAAGTRGCMALSRTAGILTWQFPARDGAV